MAELFLQLVKMSLIGSLFAVVVMIVRLAFRKAPKWIFVLLWGVVALRLILPFSVESKLSLVPDRLASGQIVTSVRDAYVGQTDVIYEQDPDYRDALASGGQPVHSEQGDYIVTRKDSVEVPKTFGETVLPVLGWIWLTGVVLMLGYTVGSYLLLKRKMAVAALLHGNIWKCERADMPFVLGVFRPKIYLPYWIEGADMDYVIAHEQAHIARRDHWWKPVGFLLLSLHWFNPVIWVAYVLLCRDIEAACDEKVIGPMDKEGVRAYSMALLNCSVHRHRIAACPLAFGETGVKERIRCVMNYKKPTFWIILMAIVIVAVVVVCFCTDPLKQEQDPQPPSLGETSETTQNITENKENTENTENTDNTNNNTNETNTSTDETKGNDIAEPNHEVVLTGPVTQYVQTGIYEVVTCTDLMNYKYVIPINIPQLLPFSEDAIACQKEIEDKYQPIADKIRDDASNGYSPSWFFIKYDAHLNGDILSVVIEREAVTGGSSFSVYNFDTGTGKRLDTAALIEKIQFADYEEKLTQAAKAAFESHWGTNGTSDLYVDRLNATVDPQNIAKADPYLDQDGKLKVVMFIGSMAGASGYAEILSLS